MREIDIVVPKGFTKKLYEYNQDLKHLFAKYLLMDNICVDANIDEALISLNYSAVNPFKDLGDEFPSKCVIDTVAIYKHLQKGRQKVKYIRISDRGLFFIKEEDDMYLELEFGKLVTDDKYRSRIIKFSHYATLLDDYSDECVPQDSIDALMNGKFVYLPCGNSALIIGKRILPGIKAEYNVDYRYSSPTKVNEELEEEHFVSQITVQMKTIDAHYIFEASVF